MIIDCSDCEYHESEHCKDCFVMAILGHDEEEPLVLDPAEEEAIAVLQEAGLAPALKFRRKAG